VLQAQSEQRVESFRPLQEPATISDAYDIQQQYVGLLRVEHGDSIGYKVGPTFGRSI
jgi:2-keto-4-pentenoate hydratase